MSQPLRPLTLGDLARVGIDHESRFADGLVMLDLACGYEDHLHPVQLLEVEIDGKLWSWPCAVHYLLAERERLQAHIAEIEHGMG